MTPPTLAQLVCGLLWTYTVTSVNMRLKQPPPPQQPQPQPPQQPQQQQQQQHTTTHNNTQQQQHTTTTHTTTTHTTHTHNNTQTTGAWGLTCRKLWCSAVAIHRGPRQFLDKVVFMPAACRQFWGPDRCAENWGSTQLQFSNMVDVPVVATTGAVLEQGGNARYCDDRCVGVLQSRKLWRFRSCSTLTRWSMSLFVHFIDGCGRPCDQAATVGVSPRLFFMTVMAAMNMAVWFGVEGLFRRY